MHRQGWALNFAEVQNVHGCFGDIFRLSQKKQIMQFVGATLNMYLKLLDRNAAFEKGMIAHRCICLRKGLCGVMQHKAVLQRCVALQIGEGVGTIR